MEYRIDSASDRTTCHLEGTLSFDDHEKFRRVIKETVASAPPAVELNLSRLSMIDSAGVGLLLLLNDQAKRANKSLRISGAAGAVRRSLDIMKVGAMVTLA